MLTTTSSYEFDIFNVIGVCISLVTLSFQLGLQRSSFNGKKELPLPGSAPNIAAVTTGRR
jgi:hypothetical protein